MRILLLEDNDIDARLVGIYCGEILGENLSIDRVTSTSEARQKLQAEDFDLCIFDFMLRAHNSALLVSDVARVKEGLPILLVSNLEREDLISRGLRQEKCHILPKQDLNAETLRHAFKAASLSVN